MNETNIEYVTVIDENSKEAQAEVLFTYEANGDQYVFYAIDENVYAARITNPNEDDQWKLVPVEEDEWKLLEKVYNEWAEENLEA